jgi:hypothetical protein
MLDLINPSALWISAAHVAADIDAIADARVSMINCNADGAGRWQKVAGDNDLDEEEKKKKKKTNSEKEEEESKKKKTALEYRVNLLLMKDKRLKKVRRKLYEEAYANCERIDSSSGEECSPIADDYHGDNVFEEGEDDEIFLEAATQYEQGLKVRGPYEHRLLYKQGLKFSGLAAMVVEVVAVATKELAGGSPTSEVCNII